jgi:hypothetical protein
MLCEEVSGGGEEAGHREHVVERPDTVVLPGRHDQQITRANHNVYKARPREFGKASEIGLRDIDEAGLIEVERGHRGDADRVRPGKSIALFYAHTPARETRWRYRSADIAARAGQLKAPGKHSFANLKMERPPAPPTNANSSPPLVKGQYTDADLGTVPPSLQPFREDILMAAWSPSYFAGSWGGVPIEIIRQYIEQQQTPH